jgi:hypothetical protein
MQRITVRLFCNLDYFFGVEIALQRGSWSYSISLIGHRHELAVLINITIDGDGLDTHPMS